MGGQANGGGLVDWMGRQADRMADWRIGGRADEDGGRRILQG